MLLLPGTEYLTCCCELTFMSSTNEGKPPIAMIVKKEAVNISSEPLAYEAEQS